MQTKQLIGYGGLACLFLWIWSPIFKWEFFFTACLLIAMWSFIDQPSRKAIKKKIEKTVDEWEKAKRE